jgi:hypothetical protein
MTRDEAQRQYGIYVRKEKERVRKVVEVIENHFGIKSSYCDQIAFFSFGNELIVFQLTSGNEDWHNNKINDKWMVTIHIAGRFIPYCEKDKIWFEDPIEAFKPAFAYAKQLFQNLEKEIPTV